MDLYDIAKWVFLIGGPAFVYFCCWRDSQREERRLEELRRRS